MKPIMFGQSETYSTTSNETVEKEDIHNNFQYLDTSNLGEMKKIVYFHETVLLFWACSSLTYAELHFMHK
jgi:hypothetical protein